MRREDTRSKLTKTKTKILVEQGPSNQCERTKQITKHEHEHEHEHGGMYIVSKEATQASVKRLPLCIIGV